MGDKELKNAVLEAFSNNTSALSLEMICASASIRGWKAKTCAPFVDQLVEPEPFEGYERRLPLWQWKV